MIVLFYRLSAETGIAREKWFWIGILAVGWTALCFQFIRDSWQMVFRAA
jgi:hypothetical protein